MDADAVLWIIGVALGAIGALIHRVVGMWDSKLSEMKQDFDTYKTNTREVLTRLFDEVDAVKSEYTKEILRLSVEVERVKGSHGN